MLDPTEVNPAGILLAPQKFLYTWGICASWDFKPWDQSCSLKEHVVNHCAMSYLCEFKQIFYFPFQSYRHVSFCDADERLNDIVGSAYYVAPEVLHRSYSSEADMWSIGVITYILLCGSRPFWARTESGIFRAVLRADPNFDDLPWPTVSPEAKDFVKRMLNKDYRKRMTAAQALSK